MLGLIHGYAEISAVTHAPHPEHLSPSGRTREHDGGRRRWKLLENVHASSKVQRQLNARLRPPRPRAGCSQLAPHDHSAPRELVYPSNFRLDAISVTTAQLDGERQLAGER